VVIVAIASLVLPYLPLLADQVLLMNVLTDLPMLAIATDVVSFEDIATPRRWDVRRLVEISIFLGVVNAILAFGLLRFFQGRPAEDIHAVWFLFLGSTGLLILFAIRTKDWFFSRPWPSMPLLGALAAAFVVTVALVNIPETKTLLHFGHVSAVEQLGIVGFAFIYLLIADVLQHSLQHANSSTLRRG
jgi:Mg2+-importing ATPase